MSVMFSALLVSVLAVSDQQAKLIDNPTIIAMHQVANEKRSQCKKCKRSELELNEKCCRMAQEWANHMAKVDKRYHGKNDQIIASGYKDIQTVFSAWMKSNGHRTWILKRNITKCGWGCQQSKGGTWYWVGVFRK